MGPQLPTNMEALTYVTANTQTIVLILTAEFSLIFAYVAGMHFFLQRARLPLRLFAFSGIFLLVFALWLMLGSQILVFENYLVIRQMAMEQGIMSQDSDFTGASAEVVTGIISWALHVVHVLTLIGLTYLTFFYDWSVPDEKGKGTK